MKCIVATVIHCSALDSIGLRIEFISVDSSLREGMSFKIESLKSRSTIF